jgi:hypothetical protein
LTCRLSRVFALSVYFLSFSRFYWLQLAFIRLGVGSTTLVYQLTKKRGWAAMRAHLTEIIVATVLFVAVAALGFVAARWRRPSTMPHLDEWGLGGRGFGVGAGCFVEPPGTDRLQRSCCAFAPQFQNRWIRGSWWHGADSRG